MALAPRNRTVKVNNPNTVREEWDGLTPEVDFQMVGDDKSWFHFLRHVTTPKGHEYVEAYGGKTTGKKAWVGMRSIALDKVARGDDGRPTTRPHVDGKL